MLTLVESLSLAGDRTKQNDDAHGYSARAAGRAWVIDGATDLHDAPLSHCASDAGWIAHMANHSLHGWTLGDRRAAVRAASRACASAFADLLNGRSIAPWQSPIASLLMLYEKAAGDIEGIDLGDCRAFALDADGVAHAIGGPGDAGDNEAKLAARQTDSGQPLLRRTNTLEMLRGLRASINQPGGAHWTFGVDPRCADHARTWALKLARPAHLLLCTDGFSALVDRYRAYDATGLVRAALDKGLQELGRELRAIEAADAAGAKHPRFKPNDDATAVLLRLT